MTPDDIAEVVVFTAGRRENVVIADSLIFPNHQVSNFVLYVHMADNTQGGGDSHASKIFTVASPTVRPIYLLTPRLRSKTIDQRS